jgi:selenocysteine-specific elongation factor
MVAEAGVRGIDAAKLAARLGVLRLDGLLCDDTTKAGDPPVVVAREAMASLARDAEQTLARFHADSPLRPGMPREELRSQCFDRVPSVLFERVIQDLTNAGTVRTTPTTVALAGYEVRLSDEEVRLRGRLCAELREAGLQGIAIGPDALTQRVVRLLVTDGTAVRLGEGLLVSRESLSGFVERLHSQFPPGSKLDVAALKQMTGLSRKWVIPLFELLDRERVTRRAGDVRLVLAP